MAGVVLKLFNLSKNNIVRINYTLYFFVFFFTNIYMDKSNFHCAVELPNCYVNSKPTKTKQTKIFQKFGTFFVNVRMIKKKL